MTSSLSDACGRGRSLPARPAPRMRMPLKAGGGVAEGVTAVKRPRNGLLTAPSRLVGALELTRPVCKRWEATGVKMKLLWSFICSELVPGTARGAPRTVAGSAGAEPGLRCALPPPARALRAETGTEGA